MTSRPKREQKRLWPVQNHHPTVTFPGLIGVNSNCAIRGVGPAKPSCNPTASGLTAGSSFQDYRIAAGDIVRKVVFYDCCPQ